LVSNSQAKVQKNVKNGKKPKIDPAYRKHSFSEKKLAELIDWCLEYKPEDRPSMFQIVEFLGEALKMARAKGET
jgi:serine/threonine protein kinase